MGEKHGGEPYSVYACSCLIGYAMLLCSIELCKEQEKEETGQIR